MATGDPVQASADEPKSSRSSRRRSSSSHSRSGAGTCWLNQMFSPSTNDHHFRWRNGSFSTFIGSIYDVTVVVGSARGSLPSTRLTCSSALPATALCWLSTTSHFAVAPLGLDLGASRSCSPVRPRLWRCVRWVKARFLSRWALYNLRQQRTNKLIMQKQAGGVLARCMRGISRSFSFKTVSLVRVDVRV